MRIQIIHYTDLNPDGTEIGDTEKLRGSVDPQGGVFQSGKHQVPTRSTEADGHWLNVSTPIKNGKKTVVTFYFDSLEEKREFKKSKRATGFVDSW